MKKYESRYSPGTLITGHQYIVELICEKRAKSLDKELPIKFWELPEWRTYFIYQSKKCSELREIFSDEAIIAALKDKEAWKIYSLTAPWLTKIILKHQDLLKKKTENNKDIEYTENATFRRTEKPSKNIIDKLKELE